MLEFEQTAIDWHWRWPFAAVIVFAMHVSVAAAALMTWQPEPFDDEPSGVVSIELAPLTARASARADELALHAPASDAVPLTATQPPAAQPADAHIIEVPVTEPSPATEPAVALPPPEKATIEDEKPDEKPAKSERDVAEVREIEPETVQQAAPPPLPASAATSPIRAETIEAHEPAAASAQGRQSRPSKVQVAWQKALLLQLDRNKRYPAAARRKRVEGTATVQFVIDRSGTVISSRIVKGSGSGALDDEAMTVLSRASPLPAPPPGVGDATIEFVLPIQFQIKN